MGKNYVGYLVGIMVVLNLVYNVQGECVVNNPHQSDCREQMQTILAGFSNISVFYRLGDKQMIQDTIPLTLPASDPVTRSPFVAEPCVCGTHQCGCCAGIQFPQYNFNRSACANITFDPNKFGLSLDVFFDSVSVFHQQLTTGSPPEFCIPIPIPLPIALHFCIKLSDIQIVNSNSVKLCMDWTIKLFGFSIFTAQFGCLKLGSEGVAIVGSNFLASPFDESTMEPAQLNGDVYDEVTEIIKNNEDQIYLNTTNTTNEFVNSTYIVFYDKIEKFNNETYDNT